VLSSAPLTLETPLKSPEAPSPAYLSPPSLFFTRPLKEFPLSICRAIYCGARPVFPPQGFWGGLSRRKSSWSPTTLVYDYHSGRDFPRRVFAFLLTSPALPGADPCATDSAGLQPRNVHGSIPPNIFSRPPEQATPASAFPSEPCPLFLLSSFPTTLYSPPFLDDSRRFPLFRPPSGHPGDRQDLSSTLAFPWQLIPAYLIGSYHPFR